MRNRFFLPCFLLLLFVLPSVTHATWKPLEIRKGQSELLTSISTEVAKTPRAVVAFDLDSTLLDNRPRTIRIMQEFGEMNHIPEMKKLEPDHFDGWIRESAMKKVGLSEKNIADLSPKLESFWKDRFFSSKYATLDIALPGAALYVQHLHDAGATIVYLTGRSEAMRKGTEKNLKESGFPIQEKRVHLLMKDEKYNKDSSKDKESKMLNITQVKKMGTVVAVFDNEPGAVNLYADEFQGAKVVFVDTDHSPKPEKLRYAFPVVNGFLVK